MKIHSVMSQSNRQFCLNGYNRSMLEMLWSGTKDTSSKSCVRQQP